MGKREEITDVISDKGIREIKVGTILKFNYEGSPIYIKVTRKDTKNLRMWGEHITLYDMDAGMSHYGHDVDATNTDHIFCKDCQVEINQGSTEDGEVKAAERAQAEAQSEANSEEQLARRFTYRLLKQDGTTKRIGKAVPRFDLQGLYDALGCTHVELVPPAYYPDEYAGKVVAIYGNGEDDVRSRAGIVRNPHLKVLEGDPTLGEPAEWDVVGDVLLEVEVTK